MEYTFRQELTSSLLLSLSKEFKNTPEHIIKHKGFDHGFGITVMASLMSNQIVTLGTLTKNRLSLTPKTCKFKIGSSVWILRICNSKKNLMKDKIKMKVILPLCVPVVEP
jgi:hypothetical protein